MPIPENAIYINAQFISYDPQLHAELWRSEGYYVQGGKIHHIKTYTNLSITGDISHEVMKCFLIDKILYLMEEEKLEKP